MSASQDQGEEGSLPVKWGVMGTASIARKNAAAMHDAPSAMLFAVGSRSVEKASQWAADVQAPTAKCFGTYEELLADPEVEAVYLPLPTGVRPAWVVRALEAGKHVLSEKPLAACLGDFDPVVAAIRATGKQFMDGVMFMHHVRLQQMQQRLAELGQVRHVTSNFCFFAPQGWDNIRTAASTEPLGCLGDVGWYNIRFSLFAFSYELPISASAQCHHRNEAGVPLALSAVLNFSNGRSATFHCSFDSAFTQAATVLGSKGTLSLDDFVICRGDAMSYFNVETDMDLANTMRVVVGQWTGHSVAHEPTHRQEANMIETFSQLVRRQARGEAPEAFWPEVALKTQAVIDAVLESSKQDGKAVPVTPVTFAY